MDRCAATMVGMEQRFAPPGLVRGVNAVTWPIGGIAAGVWLGGVLGGWSVLPVILVVALGIRLGAGAARMGVVVTDDEVQVHGLLRKRRVRRSTVRGIKYGAWVPYLVWDANGRARATPLAAFYQAP